MNKAELDSRITSLFGADPAFTKYWSQPPSAILVPFMGKLESSYLLISLCLVPEFGSFTDIASVSLSVLRLAISSGLATGLPGLEVVPYVFEAGKLHRILRISIFANAFGKISELTDADLLKEKPVDGIRCSWYREKPVL
jgi:hypothetical protein